MSNDVKVVKLIIKDQKDRFLVVREKENKKWELPGGKIEEKEDESRIEAAQRELEEELNIKAENFEDLVRVEVEEFNDIKAVNCWIMHVENPYGEIKLYEEEICEWKWTSAEDFKEMDWHADAGYAIPAMEYFDYYL